MTHGELVVAVEKRLNGRPDLPIFDHYVEVRRDSLAVFVRLHDDDPATDLPGAEFEALYPLADFPADAERFADLVADRLVTECRAQAAWARLEARGE